MLVIPLQPLNTLSKLVTFTLFLNNPSGILTILLFDPNLLITLLVTFLLNNHSGISVNLSPSYSIGILSGSGSYILETFGIIIIFSSSFSNILPHCNISISYSE